MYSRNPHTSRSSSHSGPSRSGQRSSSRRPFRSSYGRSSHGYGGNRRVSSGRTSQADRGRGAHIPHSKFISKAVEPESVEVFVPKHTFANFAIDERLKKNIVKKGYTTPTPIQDAAIPLALHGRDVVGLAETGTGKTGAFLIPLIDKVLKNDSESVLIMAPTRELAVQIDEEFRGFASGLPLRSALVIGGANINSQIRSLRYGPQFVIGTPGRIMDLMGQNELRLAKCANVVLDEADRMLDMGFIESVKKILATMPAKRHTLFFSATLGREIEQLIGDFLTEPERISVKTQDTSKNVDQDIVRIQSGRTKLDHLSELLKDNNFTKVLVFGRTKHGVEKLSKLLKQTGFSVESIHGNKSHSQRQRALQLFKDEKVQVLVATDVAARGLDIPKVSHVINFDVPGTYDDYVHRIGRTGRAGERGKALTFIE
ncbi:MAG: putative DEAD/DEAH box helicase domain protein [Parcubacteria group bacterium Gr01-1014_8]|nr:MAG: putative DEAD/DEAH box helicase domain protein [Parcubacteria group bacterium Gr01-1014_8]